MLSELPTVKVHTAGARRLGLRPSQGQGRECLCVKPEDGTRNWYLLQLITAELKVQATSEDSLEHSEVQSPRWGGGEWVERTT